MADLDHPIIVGVADVKNASKELREDGSDEPLALILQAIQAAVKDTGLTGNKAEELQAAIDSISVVRPWSWPYPDLANLLSEKLGVAKTVTYKFNSPHGGNQPAKLLDEACQRIAHGKTRVALLTGGEAMDSLTNHIQSGQLPPPGWTPVEFDASMAEGLKPPEGDDSVEGIHGLGAPIQVYAMYENAFRASKGQSFAANNEESAQMYAEFAEVSKNNPFSWHHGHADSKDTIGQVSKRNRMINTPYPMLMCAFNKVNISGACLVTSSSFAKELGIPKDRWIYVRGGAGTAESEEFYLRSAYTHSPAINQSIDAALGVADVKANEIDLFDFYSCFPIVPKLACKHLGLPTSNPPKPITLLGGLTSFGGAGNNYSMHAITEMTRRLRQGAQKNGLVLANGGVLSYQHVVVLSNEPRKKAYPDKHALPEHCEQLAADQFTQVAKEGHATIEAYTVDFTRKGAPRRGQVIGRCAESQQRFIANHADEHTLRILADTQQASEVVGRRGRVWQDKSNPKRNIFSLATEQKL
jgi:acetyl-CoA acetyltransferase